MNILVLNGSPRPNGNTKGMIEAFREGSVSAGHQVDVMDVCRMKIGGCLACEYSHLLPRHFRPVEVCPGPFLFGGVSLPAPEAEKGRHDSEFR